MIFEGKTVLVTGASGGIGSAVAEDLAARGACVALHGTKQEALEALSARCPNSKTFVADLSNPETIKPLMRAVLEWSEGKLYGLVNNAGLTRDGLAMRMTDAQWNDVLAVNLTAPFLICREALGVMMRQRAGSIVNVGSVVGTMGNVGQANYAASKAGLVGLTKSLALEGAMRNVRVNAVVPGYIATAMTDAIPDAMKEKIHIPMGRMGKAEEVAYAVRVLLSPEASYISGTTLTVAGALV